MAVRAHERHCNNAAPAPDFRSSDWSHVLQQHQIQMLDGCFNAGRVLAGAALSEHHPESELTCNNAPGPRKRSRGDGASFSSMALPHRLQHPCQPAQPANAPAAGPSTSGLAHDLVANLYHQSSDVDALVRFQMERLRSGLVEMKKRHCGALAAAAEQQVSTRLREREAELASATRRNAELEEKVRQLSADNQVWFTVAKNNEAVAGSLRAALAQVLQQGCPSPAPVAAAAPAEEGFGDSDDVQSSCSMVVRREGEELRRVGSCRGCSEGEASVLLLPCRHLCICRDCEPRLDTCPICNATKNASINVCMS